MQISKSFLAACGAAYCLALLPLCAADSDADQKLREALEKKLGNGSFNSVSGLLLFFLAMSDCEVTGARRVAIDRGGILVPGTVADDSVSERSRSRVPGVEITFRRNGSKQQTIRYFMVNVADCSRRQICPDESAFSVLDLKAYCRGYKYVTETIKMLREKPDPILVSAIFRQVTCLGSIHNTAAQLSPP